MSIENRYEFLFYIECRNGNPNGDPDMGNAPAHRLFDLVQVEKKPEVGYPRSWRDYNATVSLERRPAGVDIGFLTSPYGEISWNRVPDDAELFR